MKEEYQDRIEDYLLNRMSDSDRLAFEHELEKNAELRDQYEFISMVKTALMLENIEMDASNWTKAHKEREDAYHYSKRRALYWISGIAAVFVVGLFLFKNVVNYSSAPPLSNGRIYSEQSQESFTYRGDGRIDSNIEKLLAQGDYNNALSQIERLEGDINAEWYLLEREIRERGMSFESRPKSAKKPNKSKPFEDDNQSDDINAKKELKEKMSREQENELGSDKQLEVLKYKQDVLRLKEEGLLWLKVQALIGLDRREEAISLLDEIRHSESEYKEPADSLYYELEALEAPDLRK